MKEIMDSSMINRSLKRITYEILEKNKGASNIVIVGIEKGGCEIARKIVEFIEQIEHIKVPFVSLNVLYWRDDVLTDGSIPKVETDFLDKIIILVDDVLYKGRTVRAAMDGVMHYGRAKAIQLAVLVDRGHRELPIRADYVGKNIPTNQNEKIEVKFNNASTDGVYIS